MNLPTFSRYGRTLVTDQDEISVVWQERKQGSADVRLPWKKPFC